MTTFIADFHEKKKIDYQLTETMEIFADFFFVHFVKFQMNQSMQTNGLPDDWNLSVVCVGVSCNVASPLQMF